MANKKNKYALISVYDKSGIIELAKHLIKSEYIIIASDGTGKELQKQKIPFVSCQKVSANPDCFEGFMKTMSFQIESGIFFDRTNPVHIKDAKDFKIKQIDIVICNFVSIKKILDNFSVKEKKEMIRNFDFGGPTMVRVAAQNYKNVLVSVNPSDYKKIVSALLMDSISDKLKHQFAVKAFEYILNYDETVVRYLNN